MDVHYPRPQSVSCCENRPNGYSGRIISLEGKPDIHFLLENARKAQVKALKDICGMRGKSDNLGSLEGKFFDCMVLHMK
jgi:hypothetical protein